MNFILLIFSLASAINFVSTVPLPAVSTVHVRFVSGNKATQYSHQTTTGDGNSSPTVQYNVVDKLVEEHTVRKRSVSRRAPSDPGGFGKLRLRPKTMSTSTSSVPLEAREEPSTTMRVAGTSLRTDTARMYTLDGTNTNNGDGDDIAASPVFPSSTYRTLMKFRARAVAGLPPKKRPSPSAEHSPPTSTEHVLKPIASTTSRSRDTETTTNTNKPKDSKAVKRSPFIAGNFVTGGFNFPDFDEFGGNDFGTLRSFGGGRRRVASSERGRGSHGAHSQLNPEALTPEGVFLPPLPTEAATEYVENDPYLSDVDTAKYASQQPPFFAAFPHKRTVLALNERRVEQGLEPNILRSIRPFFPFFEIANHHSGGFDAEFHSPLELSFTHESMLPSLPASSYKSNNSAASFLYDHMDDPTLLYYAESFLSPTLSPWNVLKKKKK